MIEVSATDGLEVFTESYIAPDRSPKTGTIARENCYFLSVFFQNENWKCNFFACLDILILCLELTSCEDFEFCEEAFSVVKGGVPAGVENAVDAISGASITSQCLGTSLNNWILAYKPFLRSASAYTEPAEVEEAADSLSVSADSLAIAK